GRDRQRRRRVRAGDAAAVLAELGRDAHGPEHAAGGRGLGRPAGLPHHHDLQQLRAYRGNAGLAAGDRGLEPGERARRGLPAAVRQSGGRGRARELATSAPGRGDDPLVPAPARPLRARGNQALTGGQTAVGAATYVRSGRDRQTRLWAWGSRDGPRKPWSSSRAFRPTTQRSTGAPTRRSTRRRWPNPWRNCSAN